MSYVILLYNFQPANSGWWVTSCTLIYAFPVNDMFPILALISLHSLLFWPGREWSVTVTWVKTGVIHGSNFLCQVFPFLKNWEKKKKVQWPVAYISTCRIWPGFLLQSFCMSYSTCKESALWDSFFLFYFFNLLFSRDDLHMGCKSLMFWLC